MSINFLMEFLSKFRLPLNREKKDTYTFLSGHLQNFDDELTVLLDNQEI